MRNEGIIKDLDGKGIPGVTGQLHVLMIENFWPEDDELYFRHYSTEYSDRCKI